MGVICVQPVPILSAEFCIICRRAELVCEVLGYQAGEAYSRTGRMYVLYVVREVCLSCPQEVPERALRMFSLFCVFWIMLLVWWLKVSLVSKITPRILGVLFSGSWVLNSVMCGCRLVSCWSGVKRELYDFSVEIASLFVIDQVSSEGR